MTDLVFFSFIDFSFLQYLLIYILVFIRVFVLYCLLQMGFNGSTVSLALLLTLAALASAKAGQFRMEKVNYIYEKALQRIQDKQRLSRLEV